jgi:hypothetical protein
MDDGDPGKRPYLMINILSSSASSSSSSSTSSSSRSSSSRSSSSSSLSSSSSSRSSSSISSSSSSSSLSLSSTSAAPGSWDVHFDNTDWSVFGKGTWSGSQWDATTGKGGYGVFLDQLGTWVNGYRPTKIRITHTAGVGVDIDIQLEDSNGDNIVNFVPAATGQEIDITFGSYDIMTLFMYGSANAFSVTNIEFLS